MAITPMETVPARSRPIQEAAVSRSGAEKKDDLKVKAGEEYRNTKEILQSELVWVVCAREAGGRRPFPFMAGKPFLTKGQ